MIERYRRRGTKKVVSLHHHPCKCRKCALFSLLLGVMPDDPREDIAIAYDFDEERIWLINTKNIRFDRTGGWVRSK